MAGEFNFTAEEHKIFSEGVEAFSAAHAAALAAMYDFSRHRRLLDLGGGTGSFLRAMAIFCQLSKFDHSSAVDCCNHR